VYNTIAILFGNSGFDSLQGLTLEGSIASTSFGGRYRLLDFALSSMVNTGIRNIGLVTPQYYRSILDHLGGGKDWFLDRKAGGLSILPGAIHGLTSHKINFRMRDIEMNIEYLHKNYAENVLISRCNQVFNYNYTDALEFHNKKKADITLIYKIPEKPTDRHGRIHLFLDEAEKVYEIKKEDSEELKVPYFVNQLIIRRKVLLDIIHGYKSLETVDLIQPITENVQNLKVYGFPFSGYIQTIHTVQDYFERNMDLLDPEIREKLFWGSDRIHTKVRDNPPTKYGYQGRVRNSLISSGCQIEGDVGNSIISRCVLIEPGAQIRNSIIMQRCTIRAGTVLEYVVMDKFTEVKAGNVLKGNRDNPLVMKKTAV
jgi:glucose-1-phosphate adenylyltransferase, GlgD subunit